VSFDVQKIRQQFPILSEQVNGKPLVYLDNAATTQKPDCVIDAICNYYRTFNSNVHRGAHTLSDRATEAFENARTTLQTFINAEKNFEVLWSRGTTESINMVAQGAAIAWLKAGDEIIVSGEEHHANIVPWQMACEKSGAVLKVIPVLDDGSLDMVAYKALLNEKTQIVSVVHVSNALGTVNDIKTIIDQAHGVDAKVLIDCAQSSAHFEIDVQALDVDFVAFSAHKMFGPTGIGVLYGKEKWLNELPPSQGGGEMIESVTFEKTTYNGLPYKFEAGTPNIGGAIGFAAAVDFIESLDRDAVVAHENALLERATQKAEEFGLKIVGSADNKVSVLSFLMDGAHPGDVGTLLDQQGIAVRTGNHCAQPIMDQYGIPGTVRASFSIYNTIDEVDALFAGLEKVKMFI
jgi:cysteine desulfurase / selenocysteine lyase